MSLPLDPSDYAPLADHPGDGFICLVLFQNLNPKNNGNARYLPQLAHRTRDTWKLRVLEGSGDVPKDWRPIGWRPIYNDENKD